MCICISLGLMVHSSYFEYFIVINITVFIMHLFILPAPIHIVVYYASDYGTSNLNCLNDKSRRTSYIKENYMLK